MDANRLHPTRKNSGMTLVELMLALTILAVAIVALFGSFLSTQVLSRVNKDKHRALMDTTALMEQMGTIPLANLGTTFPHSTDIPQFNDLHVREQRVQVVYENGDPNARPLNYSVVSTWRTAGGLPARLVVRGLRAR
jgi:prepilin-type N-terminal cleavage/methylation domain-containing protein